MSGGEVAGLVVAVFWAILVAFLAVALTRLTQALKEATRLVASVTDRTVPLLGEAAATVRAAGVQLERVDAITADVRDVAADAAALSSTVSAAFGGPMVKVSAFGYGLRRAIGSRAAASGQAGTRRPPAAVPARTKGVASARGRSLAARTAIAALSAARAEQRRSTDRATHARRS